MWWGRFFISLPFPKKVQCMSQILHIICPATSNIHFSDFLLLRFSNPLAPRTSVHQSGNMTSLFLERFVVNASSPIPFFDPDCVGRPSCLESWTTHDAEPWTGCTNFRSGGQTIKMNRIKIGGYFFNILYSVICQKKATNATWRDTKTWGRLFDLATVPPPHSHHQPEAPSLKEPGKSVLTNDQNVIKVRMDLVMSCQEGHRALKHGDPRLASHSRHLLHFLVLCAQRVDWHLAWISSLINCSLWCCCCSSPRDLSPCRCRWDCRASGLLEKVAQLSGFVEAALASDKNFSISSLGFPVFSSW